jgi:hypothetical protein
VNGHGRYNTFFEREWYIPLVMVTMVVPWYFIPRAEQCVVVGSSNIEIKAVGFSKMPLGKTRRQRWKTSRLQYTITNSDIQSRNKAHDHF